MVIGSKSFKNKDAAKKFYKHVANEIIKRAKELTPVDTGNLRDSYSIEYNGTEPNDIYILNDCEYASYVHELYRYHIVGQSKFLEQAAWEIGSLFSVKTQIRIFNHRLICYLDNSVSTIDDRTIGRIIYGRKTDHIRKIYAEKENVETVRLRDALHSNVEWDVTVRTKQLYDTGKTEVRRY